MPISKHTNHSDHVQLISENTATMPSWSHTNSTTSEHVGAVAEIQVFVGILVVVLLLVVIVARAVRSASFKAANQIDHRFQYGAVAGETGLSTADPGLSGGADPRRQISQQAASRSEWLVSWLVSRKQKTVGDMLNRTAGEPESSALYL